MTKMSVSEFADASILDKPKTRAERLIAWRKQNYDAYKKAYQSCCNCAPSRAELLLVDQYELDGPVNL